MADTIPEKPSVRRVKNVPSSRKPLALGQALSEQYHDLEAQNLELRESRHILEESRDTYSDLYDFTPLGHASLDDRGIIKGINLTGARLLGLERRMVLGQPLRLWVAHVDVKLFWDHLRKCQKAITTPAITELSLVIKGRSTVHIQLQSLACTSTGGVTLYRTAMTDITERKQLAAEKDQLLAQEKHALKLAEIAIEKLKQERVLREAFVHTLTHDLRNPLAAIRLSAQLQLSKKSDLTRVQERAARIIKGVDRVDRMVGDLLDANSIHSGHALPLNAAKCNLTRLILDVVRDFSAMNGERFAIEMTDNLTGYWNANLLQRMLENLLSNAVKYGAPDTPITVAAREADGKITLSVQNLGGEMSPKDLESIFRLYKRTKSAKAGPSKGWGIGLTLVRGIAVAHGGTVNVTSEKGKGTSFIAEFPLDSRPFELPV